MFELLQQILRLSSKLMMTVKFRLVSNVDATLLIIESLVILAAVLMKMTTTIIRVSLNTFEYRELSMFANCYSSSDAGVHEYEYASYGNDWFCATDRKCNSTFAAT